jgi:hypothetical protein
MNNIQTEVLALDAEGDVVWNRDFDSKKEAKVFIKEYALSRDFWDRLAENDTFAENIETIQLVTLRKGKWEIDEERFPDFKG